MNDKFDAAEDKIAELGRQSDAAERKTVAPPYRFLNESITGIPRLAETLAKNWDAGKQQLFRGFLSAYFETFDRALAEQCLAAGEEADRTNGRDDIIFWRFLYTLHPGMKGFHWKGRSFESLSALGREMLDLLWRKDRSQNRYYRTILSEQVLSAYAAIVVPEDKIFQETAASVETSYRLEKPGRNSPIGTFYAMAYFLSGQKTLNVENRLFHTVEEFAGYMRE
ncbi:MAG: hypothetical protein LBO81_07035, partial [Clostridiales Family XIII bacterium]|nr:hypothetical protein [Clostridiales Family XIII bacterium]